LTICLVSQFIDIDLSLTNRLPIGEVGRLRCLCEGAYWARELPRTPDRANL
jgi:hypothetical protein